MLLLIFFNKGRKQIKFLKTRILCGSILVSFKKQFIYSGHHGLVLLFVLDLCHMIASLYICDIYFTVFVMCAHKTDIYKLGRIFNCYNQTIVITLYIENTPLISNIIDRVKVVSHVCK